jgi:hypothetical protein
MAEYKGISRGDSGALPEGIERRKGQDIGRIYKDDTITSQSGHKAVKSYVGVFR